MDIMVKEILVQYCLKIGLIFAGILALLLILARAEMIDPKRES